MDNNNRAEMRKKLSFQTAEKVYWIGAIGLFTLSVVSGLFFGLVGQVIPVTLLVGYGFVLRRYFTES